MCQEKKNNPHSLTLMRQKVRPVILAVWGRLAMMTHYILLYVYWNIKPLSFSFPWALPSQGPSADTNARPLSNPRCFGFMLLHNKISLGLAQVCFVHMETALTLVPVFNHCNNYHSHDRYLINTCHKTHKLFR